MEKRTASRKTANPDPRKILIDYTRKTNTSRTHAGSRMSSGKGKSKARRTSKRRKKISVSPWIILLIVAAVIGYFIVLPAMQSRNSSEETGIQIPKVTGDYYIDISHHNAHGEIKWDSLKVMTDAKGRMTRSISSAVEIKSVSGVIMKATEGLSLRDNMFARYWSASAGKGLKRGAYHFFRSSKSGKAQARHFIQTIGEIPLNDLPPVLDVESIHKGCSKETLNSRIREFLETVELYYARKPIIYTYDSFASDYIDKDILEQYPVWIAHYKTESPVLSNWMMWQFTDEAMVYGFPGKIDLSVRRDKARR